MKHIIDTDELIADLIRLKNSFGDVFYARQYAQGIEQAIDAIRALIANSPQADGMVLDVINQCAKIAEKYEPEEKLDYIDYASKEIRKLLSAYKPQADDVPPDVYDIVVDTGDGIYHTAEVVHFQQSGSKRMIQVRFGDTQADDVRKDAERYRHIRSLMGDVVADIAVTYFAGVDFHTVREPKELDDLVDQAIDKARQ